uniref:CCAAT/enhancer-binding protein gamma n=1 Tax=Myxine glutinosa TaxID=7769 RepID=UPI00358FA838
MSGGEMAENKECLATSSEASDEALPDHREPGGRKMRSGSAGTLMDKSGDDYRRRRERNNMAVKKSRIRSKEKAVETQQRVNELKEENERLEAKIQTLSKELTVLKELFLEHARGGASNEGSSGPHEATATNTGNSGTKEAGGGGSEAGADTEGWILRDNVITSSEA